MSTNDRADDTTEVQHADSLEEPTAFGHRAVFDVQIAVPQEVAVAVAGYVGLEAADGDGFGPVSQERVDVRALDLVELRPEFFVETAEGEQPLGEYLEAAGVPVEATDGQSTASDSAGDE